VQGVILLKSVITVILIVLGGLVTFLAKTIAGKIVGSKREINDADIVYVKLAGFALVIAAAVIMFFVE
jgi:hypothetical protein